MQLPIHIICALHVIATTYIEMVPCGLYTSDELAFMGWMQTQGI